MMKNLSAVLLFCLFASRVFAQDSPASSNGGCGPSEGQYDVSTDQKNHPAARPESGKALVYVIEDIERGPTMRVGLDGAWVGANKGRSYFFFSLDPGDHRVCTKWQSGVFKKTADRMGSATTLTAEAGKTYYMRIQAFQRSHLEARQDWTVKLERIEDAEGEFLVSTSRFSTYRPRK